MNRILRITVVIAMTILIILPVIPLLGWAFSTSWTYPNMMPDDLTAEQFVEVLRTVKYREAITNSVILSAVVTILSLVLGIFAAKALGTRDFKGRRAAEIFMILPALAPGISILYGIRTVFVETGMYLTWMSVVMAEVVFCLPYIVMLLIPVFRDYDVDHEAQAATLGIGKLNTFIHVTMPSIKSGLVVACMYTFMVSWSMYLVVAFLAPVEFNTIATLLLPLISSWTSKTTVAVMTVLFILPALLVFVLSSRMLTKNNDDAAGRLGP